MRACSNTPSASDRGRGPRDSGNADSSSERWSPIRSFRASAIRATPRLPRVPNHASDAGSVSSDLSMVGSGQLSWQRAESRDHGAKHSDRAASALRRAEPRHVRRHVLRVGARDMGRDLSRLRCSPAVRARLAPVLARREDERPAALGTSALLELPAAALAPALTRKKPRAAIRQPLGLRLPHGPLTMSNLVLP